MQHYTIDVETSNRAPYTPDDIDTAMETLASYSPSLSMSPYGYREVRLTVPGDSIAQAVVSAAAVVAAAIGGDPIHVDAMPEHEADLREGTLDVPELVGATEAAQILGVSPQRVRQMIDEGKLAAHRIGDRSYALVRSEVAAKRSAPAA